MKSSFKKLSPKQTQLMITKINKLDDNANYSNKHSQILVWDLPFAENTILIECSDYSKTPHLKRHYVESDKTIRQIFYTADPYKGNNLGELRLNLSDTNIDHYIRFYMGLCQNDQGQLLPIQTYDDIPFQDDISPLTLKNLSVEFQNYPIIERKDDNFTVKMICIFKQSLFEVVFNVSAQGQVVISDRTLLISDLPIKNLS